MELIRLPSVDWMEVSVNRRRSKECFGIQLSNYQSINIQFITGIMVIVASGMDESVVRIRWGLVLRVGEVIHYRNPFVGRD